jgi:hypothetical protein
LNFLRNSIAGPCNKGTASQLAEKLVRWVPCNNGTAFSRGTTTLFSDRGFSPCYLGLAPIQFFNKLFSRATKDAKIKAGFSPEGSYIAASSQFMQPAPQPR